MKKKPFFLIFSFGALFVIGACVPLIQTTEVPGSVSQTIEASKVISQTEILPEISKVVPTNTIDPALSTPQRTPQDIDSAYNQGIIIISQYYEDLSQGLYEEAYQLLSTFAKVYPLEEYSKNQKSAFKVVRIISIQPFLIKPDPYRSTPEPKTNLWFFVTIYAEGEGGMSGSVPNGNQSFYIQVTQEAGMWKINKWATGIAP